MYSNRVTIQGLAPDQTTPAIKTAQDGTLLVADATLNATLQSLMAVEKAIQQLLSTNTSADTLWQTQVKTLLTTISTTVASIQTQQASDATRDSAWQTATDALITAGNALLTTISTTLASILAGQAVATHISSAQVSIGTTSSLLVAARTARTDLLIVNNDTVNSLYIGATGVSTATGCLLAPGAGVSMKTTAAVYAVASAGSVAVSIIENY